MGEPRTATSTFTQLQNSVLLQGVKQNIHKTLIDAPVDNAVQPALVPTTDTSAGPLQCASKIPPATGRVAEQTVGGKETTHVWWIRLGLYHTLSVAFRHLPPNSARFGYATEWALFISAQLSTDAVSALRKVWVLI